MRDFKSKEKIEKMYHGFKEIDCSFILEDKKEVIIDKKKITCFASFKSNKELEFYSNNNFKNIIIKKMI